MKKAGYRIFREGSEESEGNKGWFSWMWNWSESHSKQQLDVKPGSTFISLYSSAVNQAVVVSLTIKCEVKFCRKFSLSLNRH